MSTREFKPGDVAIVTWKCGMGETRSERRIFGHTPSGSPAWWDGYGTWIGAERDARPLVVIDPEEIVHAPALIDLLRRNGWRTIAAAIEEALHPTKPDEPTGLGAVVESSEGRLYVRAGDGWLSERVSGIFRNPVAWPQIDAVKVLSEGVTP